MDSELEVLGGISTSAVRCEFKLKNSVDNLPNVSSTAGRALTRIVKGFVFT